MECVEESPNLTSIHETQQPAVVDTTELRWFAREPLPPEVSAWFTRDGRSGALEERCDSYRLDGRSDIGVKARFQETLELKVRQSVGARFTPALGLAGRLENWRKWSPADDLVETDHDARWIDVHKRVIKRRFSTRGEELVYAAATDSLVRSGVDVEVAEVTVGGIEAWTFAFAAFGPIDGRRDALGACWLALAAGPVLPRLIGSFADPSRGYPEWLALVVGHRPGATGYSSSGTSRAALPRAEIPPTRTATTSIGDPTGDHWHPHDREGGRRR